MRKFVAPGLLLALAVLLAPQGQAATRCIHFTNFCDTINVNNINVHGITGQLVYGGWDWQCVNDWTTTSIAGRVQGGFVTLVSAPAGFPYEALFTFQVSNHLFDLYGTTSSSALALQTNQPWTVDNGPCPAPNKNLLSLMGQ
ncbi:MAG: hypothetical protein LAO09_20045 [Acidobacteriia bacterium]|nr:hypothetical protein [Terriglobia bacterium]